MTKAPLSEREDTFLELARAAAEKKRAGTFTLHAFFEVWAEVRAVCFDATGHNDVDTGALLHKTPQEYIDAVRDGRFDAWLAANPVRKVG